MTSSVKGRLWPSIPLAPDTRVAVTIDGQLRAGHPADQPRPGTVAATIIRAGDIEYDIALDALGPVPLLRVPAADVYPLPLDLDELRRVFELLGVDDDGRLTHPHPVAVGRAGLALLGEVRWRVAALDELLAIWRALPEHPNRNAAEAVSPELVSLLVTLDDHERECRL